MVRESGAGKTKVTAEGAIEKNKKQKPCGVFHGPTPLSEAERNAQMGRASSATLDVQSIATEFGRDRDMRRNVPMGALLTPQPKAREKPSAAREQQARKKCASFTHGHSRFPFGLGLT